MSEIQVISQFINLNLRIQYQDNLRCIFPKSENYCEYVLDWVNSHQKKVWCNRYGTGLYNKIQIIEGLPDVSMRINGIYLFSDETGTVVYVGKSSHGDRILNRVLDHLMPPPDIYPNSNNMQNTPGLWTDYISKGKKLQIDIFMGLSGISTGQLERQIYDYCDDKFGHTPLYNKATPF